MRPRLRKWHGIWHCLSRCEDAAICGLGYTPSAAYRDWAGLLLKALTGELKT